MALTTTTGLAQAQAQAQALVGAMEATDEELRVHCQEVSHLAVAVAPRLGVERRRRERLLTASLLHDLGKLAISKRILSKRGPLTPEERAAVETHPRIGARLVERVPALQASAPLILYHHERWDGDGYPAGLRREQIPLEARIIGVVDAFAAMLAERPYSGAMAPDEACAELERCAGTQFDPAVVEAFVAAVRPARRRARRAPSA